MVVVSTLALPIKFNYLIDELIFLIFVLLIGSPSANTLSSLLKT